MLRVEKELAMQTTPEAFEACRKGKFNRVPLIFVGTKLTFFPEHYPFDYYLCEGVLFEFRMNGEEKLPDFAQASNKMLKIAPTQMH